MKLRLNFSISLALGVCLWVAGCSSVPDLEPFSQSTAEIHEAIRVSHDVVRGNLQLLAANHPKDPHFAEFAVRFSRAWETRLIVVDVLLDYSDSLAGIVDAGQHGRESANALAASLKSLTPAMGPMSVIPGEAVEIAAIVYGAVAQVRMASTLSDAVNEADGAIRQIAALLDRDFQSLDENFLDPQEIPKQLELDILNAYRQSHGADLAYRDLLINQRKKLQGTVAERIGAIPSISAKIRSLEAEVATIGEQMGTVDPDEKATLERRLREKKAELQAQQEEMNDIHFIRTEIGELDKSIEQTDIWYGSMMGEIVSMYTRLAEEQELLRKTQKAILRWAAVHHRLAEDLRENRRPNIKLLVNMAVEIKSVVERMKE